MVLDDLKPAGWDWISRENKGQIGMLLNAVAIETGENLTESQKTGVSLVAELIGESHVQIGRDGKLVLTSFNPKTGDAFPELSDDVKEKVRDVARLLKVEATRWDHRKKTAVKL